MKHLDFALKIQVFIDFLSYKCSCTLTLKCNIIKFLFWMVMLYFFPFSGQALVISSCLYYFYILGGCKDSVFTKMNIVFLWFRRLTTMWSSCECAKSLQSHLILCYPMDCSLPSSSVYGILQERILECWSTGILDSILQGIFLTQGLNLHLLCLLHWQAGSLPKAPPGKPLWSSYLCLKLSFIWALSTWCNP